MSKKTLQYIIGYVFGGLLFLFLMPYGLYRVSKRLDHRIPIQLIPFPALRFLISTILFIIGWIFGIGSNIILNIKGEGGPVEFANVEISPKTQNLVETGLYRYTRNPMLFGACMIYYAVAIYLNSIVAFILVTLFSIFMLIFVKLTEERRLLKDFGSEYEEYRQKVSMFIPWLKKTN
jgi:protein-S-isoprenylcysteine O-methyltransferase Ste14